MSSGPENEPRIYVEDIATEGLELALVNDYGERFQNILDQAGAGLAGQIPRPEGLILKALYHQHRNISPAHYREESAIEEVTATFNGEFGELSPQVTPPLIYGLALLLQRATRPREQELIADALEASGRKLRDTGYIHGK